MRSVSAGRRPAITSSSSRSFGSVASARATSRRLRSGSVSAEAELVALAEQVELPEHLVRTRGAPRARSCRCNSAPTMTLSSTESAGNGRTSWKVRPMPRAADLVGRAARRCVRRRRRSSRRSGANTPAMMLNSVVLPAPFGPMTAKIEPCATRKLTLSTASRPRKRLLTASIDRSARHARASRHAELARRATATRRPAAPSRPRAGRRP